MKPVIAGPMYLDFILGWRCNADCVQCWEATHRRSGWDARWNAHKWKREFPPAALDAILAQYSSTLQAVTLISFGEPMLHPEFRQILNSIAARKTADGARLGLSMVTNGSLLHLYPDVVSGPGTLTVSFDAPEAALYESIRRNLSFQRVVDNLRLAAKGAGRPGRLLYVNMTVFQRNAHTVYAMAQLLSDIGFDGLAVIRGAALDLSGLQAEELPVGFPAVHAQIAKARADFPKLRINDYFSTIDGPFATSPGEYCNMPWVKMDFTPDGMAHPCCRAYAHDLGLWNTNPWTGPAMSRLRGQLAAFNVDPVEFKACAICSMKGHA